ncbi:diguanylate cyclase [Halomicronema sp. CCY15110]|uniref:diguanylate cyclase n=1 Tax=Halomicronema sp. CCY15110 TaxID=2767773 RepID=UPI001950F7C4|nr:diguanylate cyclase [Halomicronema sp. CCY15110]
MPLRLVLTVPFVIQVLGIVGVVGYLSYRSGKNAVNELAYQLMAESSDRITSDLNGYLQSAHQINRANIAALESGVVSLQGLEQLHRYMILQHLQLPAVTSIIVGTPEGEFRVIHRISANGLSDVKPTELPYEAGRSDAVDSSRLNLYTINEAGQLGRYAGTLEDIDVRDLPWFRQAAETGQPGWIEPHQIGATNRLTINGYTPFYDPSQRFAGAFGVNLSLDRLNDFLAEHSVSPSGQVFIVERNGLLIANSTGELPFTSSHTAPHVATGTPPIFTPGEITFHRLSMATSANPIIRATSQAITTQVGDLDTIRSAQNLEIAIRDGTQAESLECRQNPCQPYFLRITPYQDGYGLDWLIVTVVPQSDFMGAIYANVRRTIVLCGVALVGAIGLGIWTARRIARSLSRLTQAAQGVAAGDLATTLPPAPIAEVEVLTTAFRQMALELRQAAQFQQHYAQHLEQQVAEKTAALTEAQRIARVGSWEFDVVTGVFTWSAEQSHIMGREPTADLPRYPDILALISPADRPMVRAAVETAIAQGTPYTVEHGIIRPDQSICYVISRGEAVVNDQGEVVKVMGTITDITDRKQAEQALVESDRRFRAIFNTTFQFIGLLTPEGMLLEANQTALNFGGLTRQEVINRPFWEARWWTISPATQAQLKEAIAQAAAGQFVRYEVDVLGAEGRVATIDFSLSPIRDETGQVVLLIPEGRDISDRKQAEAALTQAKQQLENRIVELNQRYQEMESLGKMSDFLQACLTLTDIYETLPSLLQPLFPGCSGSLFSVDPAATQAQVVATWGTQPPSVTTWPIEDYEVLCRGKDYRGKPEVLPLRGHPIPSQDTATLCIPMIAQGETLGLFYITVNGPEALPEGKQQLARTVAEQVSLAIANLQLRETLQQQSIRDPLTGLYNRRYLEASLTQAIAQAQRYDQAIGVIMLDIDHFKQFNDTYGHTAGDHVLQAVGALLKENVRGADIACRYGGEEMTLILPESPLAQSQLKAEAILRAIAGLELTYNGQPLPTLTASLGVASFPQHGATASALVQAADAALYCAKASGRNQVVVARS